MGAEWCKQRAGHAALTLLGFVLVAVASTWPLLRHITTHVLGPWRSDNFEYLWKLWWVPEALFNRATSPFIVPDMYYPHGYALAYGEITPVHTFLLAPLTYLVGPVLVYNLAVMASIALTGWLTYLLACRWLRDLGKPRLVSLAALVAAAAFTFSGYRMHRITGHLPLVDTQWIVLAILGLDRWLVTRRQLDAALVAVAIGLATLSSWYYGFMLLFILPVYAVARARNIRAVIADRRTWLSAGLVFLIVGGTCAPFLIPYLNVSQDDEMHVPLRDASFWAASPLDYLMPNPRHPLWGEFVQSIMWPLEGAEMPAEFAVTTGYVPLLLGGWAWRRVSGTHWQATKWMIVIGFVLSLGPYLHLGRFSLGIPLPALLLRSIVPFADSVRSWGRFSLFVGLGLSVLTGAGVVLLLRDRSPRAQHTIALGVLGLVLFTTWTGPWKLIPVEPRPVDLWLAEQPGNQPLMQYPIGEALSGQGMWYTRYHGRPVVFGYGTYFPFLFRERYPELLDFPEEDALDWLAEWDVQFVLIDLEALKKLPHDSREKFELSDVESQSRLRYVTTIGDQAVYELKH